MDNNEFRNIFDLWFKNDKRYSKINKILDKYLDKVPNAVQEQAIQLVKISTDLYDIWERYGSVITYKKSDLVFCSLFLELGNFLVVEESIPYKDKMRYFFQQEQIPLYENEYCGLKTDEKYQYETSITDVLSQAKQMVEKIRYERSVPQKDKKIKSDISEEERKKLSRSYNDVDELFDEVFTK